MPVVRNPFMHNRLANLVAAPPHDVAHGERVVLPHGMLYRGYIFGGRSIIDAFLGEDALEWSVFSCGGIGGGEMDGNF